VGGKKECSFKFQSVGWIVPTLGDPDAAPFRATKGVRILPTFWNRCSWYFVRTKYCLIRPIASHWTIASDLQTWEIFSKTWIETPIYTTYQSCPSTYKINSMPIVGVQNEARMLIEHWKYTTNFNIQPIACLSKIHKCPRIGLQALDDNYPNL